MTNNSHNAHSTDGFTDADDSSSKHSSAKSLTGKKLHKAVSLSEEDLVDRMLSQFPEFGTNRPTPFTAIDDDDMIDNYYSSAGGATSPSSALTAAEKDVMMMGDNNNYIAANNSNNAAGGEDSQAPNTRFFTDDASDMIGKFFFGSSAATVTARPHPPPPSPSLKNPPSLKKTGSASSLSTMTSTASSAGVVAATAVTGGSKAYPAKKKWSHSGGVVIVGHKRDYSNGNSNAEATLQKQKEETGDGGVGVTTTAATTLEKQSIDYSSVWDQDEIDLWTNSSTIAPPSPTKSSVPGSKIDQRKITDDIIDGTIKNKRMMDRQQKRQNWDAMVASNSPTSSLKGGRIAGRGSSGGGGGEENETFFAFERDDREDISSFFPIIHDDNNIAHTASFSQQEQEQHMNVMPPSSEEGGTDTKLLSTLKGGAVVVDDGKDHWMPDKLCKHCYSCEAPFTLLRRKHHCRVCGMIFCSSCSAYFVQITEAPSSYPPSKPNDNKVTCGMMRTCKMCYDHLAARGLGVVMRGLETDSKVGESNNDEKHSPTTFTDDQPTMDVRASLTQISSLHDILPDASPALSITKQRLDDERRKREEFERLEAKNSAEGAAGAEGASTTLEVTARSSMVGSFQLKSRLESVRQMKWKGSSHLREDGLALETPVERTAVEVNVEDDTVLDRTEPLGQSDMSSSHDIGIAESNSGIEEALLRPKQSRDAKLSAKIHLGMVAADHLEKLGWELLQTDGPGLLKEIKQTCAASNSDETKLRDLWVDTLMTLATRCCATVEPDVKNGDLLDIRPYCKVKTIPGGSVLDSVYMSGVVFHKNVSHKKMARAIQNAKIMMLSGGIEYTRSENQIASLDALLEQEERYMEIIVSKMFKLKPDVLIVGKSVCRKAQELLLRANIVLIQYVKPSLMSRIARQTGATVLSSIDHVMNSSILGK
jgi:hypothetical protein